MYEFFTEVCELFLEAIRDPEYTIRLALLVSLAIIAVVVINVVA